MHDSEHEPPDRFGRNQFLPTPGYRDPLTWAIIGFAVGTLAVAPFLRSVDIRGNLLGGALLGGTPSALIGLMFAIKRRKKLPQPFETTVSDQSGRCPMCGSTTKLNASHCPACGEQLLQPDSDLDELEPQPWWNRIPAVVGFAIIFGMIAFMFWISNFFRP